MPLKDIGYTSNYTVFFCKKYMLCRIYLDIRICNKKWGYDTRFAAKKIQIEIRLDFLKKKKTKNFYRRKLIFLGVTMCNAGVNYPTYFCFSMKN